jgi:alkyldihydroxyacetonephosphate synthase
MADKALNRSGQSLDPSLHDHLWGYRDTRFRLNERGVVELTGHRYDMSGTEMPLFWPFVQDILGHAIDPTDLKSPNAAPVVPEPRPCPEFRRAVETVLDKDRVSDDAKVRLNHSHGQTSNWELYQVIYENLERVADLVVWPESTEEAKHLIRLAVEHGVCLVPYGGGTNVSNALLLSPAETRPIVSVDMSRMNRVLSIDETNQTARVQAGITGSDLESALRAEGWVVGHEPDSMELSTLGGWISTNASGMKKNRYGNIEDIVLEATLVSPTGAVETLHTTPRNSTGIQPRGLLFGSEGNLGIITKAVLKIHPLPEVREYGSLVFKSFAQGVEYLQALRQTGTLPASIRLVNNQEFRFGQALKAAPSPVKHLKEKVQKFALFKLMGFDPLKMAACTIAMEGSRAEVDHQKRTIFKLAKAHGGKSAGATNGRRGYMLTFGIAYIRDFLNQFDFLGETFETSVPWSRIHDVTQAVQAELTAQCSARGVAGRPYLSYRVTQTYHTGVCIYFTMGFCGRGLEHPIEVYHDIEHALRQTILDNGGSLSHHHGIGKIRQSFVQHIQSDNSIEVLRKTKEALDPQNVFGIQNGIFGSACRKSEQ